MDKQVVISYKTVIFTLLLLVGLYVLYRLGAVIGLFIIALLIVFSVEPIVHFFMKGTLLNRKIPRSLAVIMTYVALLLVVALVITLGLPPMLVETQKLIKNLGPILTSLNLQDHFNFASFDILPQASKLSGSVLALTLGFFSNVTAFFTIYILALYLSLDWPNIKRRFASLFPDKTDDLVFETITSAEKNVGNWVKGELTLMLVVGLLSLIGLTILGVNYPMALALVAGLLEAVPMLGPILSAILAGIIGFSQAPIKGLGVIVLFTIIQQLENNILVPQVMKKVSGFSPVIILLALMVGGELFGLVGAILAVPLTMVLSVILSKFFNISGSE
jgi:predicted PurR-regulated permease PerM